jgi:membrane-bound metal-dependent hydrolase YbcI (DUF457 family)
VLFTYLGIEHIEYTGGDIHLGFLPYSHSIGTAVGLSLLVGAAVPARQGDRTLAVAVALAIVSHIVLDIIQHESDIYLLPIAWGPRFGLRLMDFPVANLLVELAYGVACWRIFRGTVGLLIGIVLFNLLDAPLMFRNPRASAVLAAHTAWLTTIILVQIVASWLLVARLARPSIPARAPALSGEPG